MRQEKFQQHQTARAIALALPLETRGAEQSFLNFLALLSGSVGLCYILAMVFSLRPLH